ncbi:MAG: LamG domain-containing protein, partial [Fuerstiella sp.]|nr:LamG domain-containing protein [Fuerstiella sp.]
ISFWVKSSSSSQGTLLSTYNATNGKWISTEFNGDVNGGTDVGKVRAGIDDNTTKKLTNTYTASYNDGTWRHFVVERNNTDGQLRVLYEGISVSSVAIGGYGDITSTVPLRIGSNNTVSSGFFDGVMDDIRVYDRVLTQAEITHLATSRGIEGSPSTPTAQYNAFATHAFKQLFQTRLR